MEMNKMMNVKNRSTSVVVYKVNLDNGSLVRREFSPGETQRVTYDELVKLTYQPGGRALIENFLQITDPDAIDELNVHTEPEYHMSEVQVVDLLKTGSMDAFLDCLDFAPIGVIDLVKKFAISLPLNDAAKRQVLKEKTGFDVDKALAMSAPDPEDQKEGEAITPTRRTQKSTTPGRRTEGSKYKVVSRADN